MLAKLFQEILLEIKSKIPFSVGVVDENGAVISCTETKNIGETVAPAAVFFSGDKENGTAGEYTFYRIGELDSKNYAIFADSVGEMADAICKVTAVAIANSKSLFDEKHDKVTFIKRIILDNILPGDIYIKSREMNFKQANERIVYLISMDEGHDIAAIETLNSMFPDKNKDFIVAINENEVALVKSFCDGDDTPTALGEKIDAKLRKDMDCDYTIGIGSSAPQLKDLARSFKEAQIAVEIGKVFEENKTVINFESLGIGRLIYQLPTTLCEMFLNEVFKKGSIDSLDDETLFTIQKFFENNLNVSVTSRNLFVHRNTLVYRLEKIKKLTGLDLREFDNAIVLKVALMVKKYLKSRERLD